MLISYKHGEICIVVPGDQHVYESKNDEKTGKFTFLNTANYFVMETTNVLVVGISILGGAHIFKRTNHTLFKDSGIYLGSTYMVTRYNKMIV